MKPHLSMFFPMMRCLTTEKDLQGQRTGWDEVGLIRGRTTFWRTQEQSHLSLPFQDRRLDAHWSNMPTCT